MKNKGKQIINQITDIEWTPYMAVGIAEGFEESNKPEATLEAWAFLIATGMCWTLQGWFGRNAKAIIETGIIDNNGKINWDMYNDSAAFSLN